jgi:small subunit ribosomal protein S16
MSVKLRLRRDGSKKRPFYHLVAADSRRARNGRFIEELGYYNPIVAAQAEPTLVLKDERIRYWLSVGAQPSETAAALLKKKGLMERTVPKTAKAPAAAASEATTEATVVAAAASPASPEDVTEATGDAAPADDATA